MRRVLLLLVVDLLLMSGCIRTSVQEFFLWQIFVNTGLYVLSHTTLSRRLTSTASPFDYTNTSIKAWPIIVRVSVDGLLVWDGISCLNNLRGHYNQSTILGVLPVSQSSRLANHYRSFRDFCRFLSIKLIIRYSGLRNIMLLNNIIQQ